MTAEPKLSLVERLRAVAAKDPSNLTGYVAILALAQLKYDALNDYHALLVEWRDTLSPETLAALTEAVDMHVAAGIVRDRRDLDRLDAELCVVSIKGKVRIFRWEPSELHPGKSIPAFSTRADLSLYYANQWATVEHDGKPKRVPLLDVWLHRAESPRATGLTLDPSGERFVGGALNVWQGWGIEPKPGEWPLLKQHLVRVICSGDKALARYLMNWMAWTVQNPTRQSEVVIVLRGKKGTGKGKFVQVLCRLFGPQSLHISSQKHLVGNFNSHLLGCCFLFSDEALWPGHKEHEGTLKRLITEPTLTIEPKGIDSFEAPNRISLVMSGNESWIVPASTDERRFAVFPVSDARIRDFDYFARLDAEAEAGGDAAFLHDLLHRELNGWHPRQDVPQNAALDEQKIESADPADLWLGGLLEAGCLPTIVHDPVSGRRRRVVHHSDPARARPQFLFRHFVASDKRLVHWSEPKFYAFLDREGIHPGQRDKRGKARQFPPLAEARAAWNRARSWWRISDDGSDWRLAPEWAEDERTVIDEDLREAS